MSEAREHCLFCGNSCEMYRRAMHSYSEYICDSCGSYAISDLIKTDSIKTLSIMRYYLLHKRRNNDKYIFFVKDASIFQNDEAYYVDEQMLNNLLPKTFNDKIDMIMLNLSTEIKSLGDDFILPGEYTSPFYYMLFMVDDSHSEKNLWQQIDAVIEILDEYGLVKHVRALGDNENSYTFTAHGWNHVSDLQTQNQEIAQAFIAMWFDSEMAQAREIINKAIVDSGYMPIIIDAKEHNNQIVPEIFYEIQKSRFIVADLTGHRNGVYYEAGYAQALGKEVILTCKESAFGERHFDVAQKNTIQWVDEKDLYNRLLKRIEATVGKKT